MAAHVIAELAREVPQVILPYVDDVVDAIERPEAQTRWEALDALTSMAKVDPDAAAKGFDGAETSLFDEGVGPSAPHGVSLLHDAGRALRLGGECLAPARRGPAVLSR